MRRRLPGRLRALGSELLLPGLRASSPHVSVPTEHVAANTAASLATVLFAMLVSAPTYFVLASGLLASTLSSPTDDAPPTTIHSKLPEPLPNSGGSVLVPT